MQFISVSRSRGNTNIYSLPLSYSSISTVIPSVTISTPPTGLIVGDSLTLTCTDSQGVPPPSFTWQKCSGSSPADCTTLDGEEDNVNILQMQSSSSMLMVNPVKLSNGGEYKCRAQNSFGLKIIEQQIGVSSKWHFLKFSLTCIMQYVWQVS